MTPAQELLAAARNLLISPSCSAGWRANAIATLARQALEAGMDAYWQRVAPGTEQAHRSVQLLCLAVYAGDDLGGLASLSWVSLSGACHVRAYDPAPSGDELARWADNVERVLAGLGEAG